MGDTQLPSQETGGSTKPEHVPKTRVVDVVVGPGVVVVVGVGWQTPLMQSVPGQQPVVHGCPTGMQNGPTHVSSGPGPFMHV